MCRLQGHVDCVPRLLREHAGMLAHVVARVQLRDEVCLVEDALRTAAHTWCAARSDRRPDGHEGCGRWAKTC